MEVKAVRRLKPAELNDDLFGQKLGRFETEAELRERIEEMLERQALIKEARQSKWPNRFAIILNSKH